MSPTLLLRITAALGAISLAGCDDTVEKPAVGTLEVEGGNACPSLAEAKELLRNYPFSYNDGKSRCGGAGCRSEGLLAVNGEGTKAGPTVTTCCYEVQSPCASPDGADDAAYRSRLHAAGCMSATSGCLSAKDAVPGLARTLRDLGCETPLRLEAPTAHRVETCSYPVTAAFDCSDDDGLIGCGRPLLYAAIPRVARLVSEASWGA